MRTFTVFAREQITMRRSVHQPFSTYSTFKMISTKFDSGGRGDLFILVRTGSPRPLLDIKFWGPKHPNLYFVLSYRRWLQQGLQTQDMVAIIFVSTLRFLIRKRNHEQVRAKHTTYTAQGRYMLPIQVWSPGHILRNPCWRSGPISDPMHLRNNKKKYQQRHEGR
jgi:hypothetical protein